MVDHRSIPTPHGPGRLVQRRASHPVATLVLTHGAGAGIDTHDLHALSMQLPKAGISVALVEQPWRVADKKVAAAPRILDEGFIAIVNRLRPQTPMFLGGRSAGARVACRTARTLGAVGVVALAFPLHPPGRPEKSRYEELAGARLPTLVVQGGRDPFGTPAEFSALPAAKTGTELVEVPYADHSFRVGARSGVTQAETTQAVVDAVRTWVGGSSR